MNRKMEEQDIRNALLDIVARNPAIDAAGLQDAAGRILAEPKVSVHTS